MSIKEQNDMLPMFNTCFVQKQYVDAIRAAGLSPETLAFAVGCNINDVNNFFEQGLDKAIEDTVAGDSDAFYRYITSFFNHETAVQFALKLNTLGILLTENNDCDGYISGMIAHLHNVNKLSARQLSEVTGLSEDALYDFCENSESISYSDKYQLATAVTRLHTMLNYGEAHSVRLESFIPNPTKPSGLTQTELLQALSEKHKPFLRTNKSVT